MYCCYTVGTAAVVVVLLFLCFIFVTDLSLFVVLLYVVFLFALFEF